MRVYRRKNYVSLSCSDEVSGERVCREHGRTPRKNQG